MWLCIFSNWSQYCSSGLWGGTNEMKCDHIPILLLERKGNILWSLKIFLEERGSQGGGICEKVLIRLLIESWRPLG